MPFHSQMLLMRRILYDCSMNLSIIQNTTSFKFVDCQGCQPFFFFLVPEVEDSQFAIPTREHSIPTV